MSITILTNVDTFTKLLIVQSEPRIKRRPANVTTAFIGDGLRSLQSDDTRNSLTLDYVLIKYSMLYMAHKYQQLI